MKRAHVILTLSLSLFAAGAHAQPTWTEIDDESVMIEALGMSVGELEGTALYGVGGEHIGDLDDVLRGEDGIVYVSIDVGGFLGFGAKDVAVSIDDLSRTDEGLSVELTREQIETLPELEE